MTKSCWICNKSLNFLNHIKVANSRNICMECYTIKSLKPSLAGGEIIEKSIIDNLSTPINATLIVATNKQLWVYKNKDAVFRDNVKITAIPYSKITSILVEQGGGLSTPKLKISSVNFDIKFGVDDYHKATDLCNWVINKQTISQTVENKAVPSVKKSKFDEIKKYKELLDLGIITEEEFDIKKNDLLDI